MNSILTILLLLGFLTSDFVAEDGYFLPITEGGRKSVHYLTLTDIGRFGLLRKSRPGIPAHFHTGIDIKRPSGNYLDEPIYTVKSGIVISKRTDGAYAQLIIEHLGTEGKFWTLYEHIAGIEVDLGDQVSPNKPIARFMDRSELDRYGWQFDHFHFEVLKVAPLPLQPSPSTPERYFSSYTLTCFTRDDVHRYFHHPLEFLEDRLDN